MNLCILMNHTSTPIDGIPAAATENSTVIRPLLLWLSLLFLQWLRRCRLSADGPRVERVWPAAGAAESTTIMHLPRTEYQGTMDRERAWGGRRPNTRGRTVTNAAAVGITIDAATQKRISGRLPDKSRR